MDPELEVRQGPRSVGLPSSLAILLHGVGATPQSLASLVDGLQAQHPQTTFVVPPAPEPFDAGGSGRQWFSIKHINDANRLGRVEAALPMLRSLIDREMAGAGVGPERTALVGFSQGAILALHLAAGRLAPLAGVAAIAGRLSAQAVLVPGRAARVLLSHGEADPVIPAIHSRQAADRLREAGFATELQMVPNWGHGIHDAQTRRVSAFLSEILVKECHEVGA